MGTYFQATGTSYPGHAHEPVEMYHTLVGTTQWGESLDALNWYGPDEFRFHPSCHPHAMVVRKNIFLYKFLNVKDFFLHLIFSITMYYYYFSGTRGFGASFSYLLLDGRCRRRLLVYRINQPTTM